MNLHRTTAPSMENDVGTLRKYWIILQRMHSFWDYIAEWGHGYKYLGQLEVD